MSDEDKSFEFDRVVGIELPQDGHRPLAVVTDESASKPETWSINIRDASTVYRHLCDRRLSVV
jgi:hypothetical protein